MTSNLPNIPSTPPSSYLASRLAQAQGKPLPAGEAIASFVRHDDALAAFDVLSEQDYPVTALYLVNDGIRQVEYPVQPRLWSCPDFCGDSGCVDGPGVFGAVDSDR